ncbi:MAG: hypothetical protein ABEJ93_03695 [Candidatus Nanohalobium sp.]
MEAEIDELVYGTERYYPNRDRQPMLRLFFLCSNVSGELNPSDDLDDVRWVEKEELRDFLETDLKWLERPQIAEALGLGEKNV